MSKKLIFTDPHIEEKALGELEEIFQEIYSLEEKVDALYMLGDYYDKKKPTPREILFGTKWAVKFKKKFKTIMFLEGNHDRTEDFSTVDYLEYFGIKILSDLEENNVKYGHFMTNKSLMEYGTHKYTVTELSKYDLVLLGHQHQQQKIGKNIYHLGSIRYLSFNEVHDKHKYMYILEDKKLKEIPLKSPIKMYEISTGDVEGYAGEQVSKIPKKAKVRIVYSNYNIFKQDINMIPKWRNKFLDLKIKLDFEKTETKQLEEKSNKKLIDILNEGIKNIKDNDTRKLIEEVLNENNNSR